MNAQNKSTSPSGSGGQSKTVTYKFVTGETSEVEVSGEVAAFLAEADKAEHAQEVAERRHTYSLDAILYEGSEYSSGETPEARLQSALDRRRINDALSCLTETQKRRLLTLSSGCTFREIAQRERVNVRAVFDCIEAARKKIIENLKKS